jgi:hypothetical protein
VDNPYDSPVFLEARVITIKVERRITGIQIIRAIQFKIIFYFGNENISTLK